VIVDIRRFVASGDPYWRELDALVTDLETHTERRLTFDEAKRFHFLYKRASADLVRVDQLPYAAKVRSYLEPLVARAYAEIHETRVKGRFSAFLMTHNTKVAVLTLGMGVTWGLGTLVLLFSNGVMLGAVVVDYIVAGEARFVMGWLMPHGVIEIPAILIAGQAGFVLAWALIGRGSPLGVRMRLRAISDDLVTLIFGVAVLLVWAGIVESFFSQYHEPVLPYGLKIAFGLVELTLLSLFLAKSGSSATATESNAPRKVTPWH